MEDELYELSLHNFERLAGRITTEYAWFSQKIYLVSFGLSIMIIILCAKLIFKLNVLQACSFVNLVCNKEKRRPITGTNVESLKYMRSV